MSHIVKGRVELAYTDEQVLRKALETIGKVLESERATIATPSDFILSGERYPLVLQSRQNAKFRMGFKQDQAGNFVPYCDEWGALGQWSNQALDALKDRYIAYHYEKQLTEEGYKVSVQQQADGSLEVLAEEATW